MKGSRNDIITVTEPQNDGREGQGKSSSLNCLGISVPEQREENLYGNWGERKVKNIGTNKHQQPDSDIHQPIFHVCTKFQRCRDHS